MALHREMNRSKRIPHWSWFGLGFLFLCCVFQIALFAVSERAVHQSLDRLQPEVDSDSRLSVDDVLNSLSRPYSFKGDTSVTADGAYVWEVRYSTFTIDYTLRLFVTFEDGHGVLRNMHVYRYPSVWSLREREADM